MTEPLKGFHTLIGAGASIKGEMTVNHDIRVDGRVEGRLLSTGQLVVGEAGVVEAQVEVRSAKISGKMVGNITVAEKVELEESATLTGDIRTRHLIISEGAVFHGNCSMQQPDGQPS